MSKQLLLQRTASLIALMIWHGFLPMSGADALDFSGWSKDCMHQNAGQIENDFRRVGRNVWEWYGLGGNFVVPHCGL